MTLTVVKPSLITPAMVNSSVLEDEYPPWELAATYTEDARVIFDHRVWQSLQAANTGKQPDSNAPWWVEVGPTNRMKAFDLSHTTQTRFAHTAWFEINTGRAVNGIALLAFDGLRSVRVRVIDPGYGTVYDKTTMLWTHPDQSGWYPWTFGERHERSNFFALDLPSYPTAKVQLDFEAASDAGIGVILLGQQKQIGLGVLAGVRMGIVDYSRKTTNEWGDVTLQKRGFSRTRTLDVLISNDELDNVDRILSDLRATPAFWVLSDRRERLNVYGKYNGYDLGVQYARNSELSLQLEGLLES